MKQNKLSKVFLYLVLFVVLGSVGVSAHETSDAYVRVVSADPATNTYTFACVMNNTFLRDWAIRPDGGDTSVHQANEAEINDLAHDEYLTYTFETDSYYHVGCQIVSEPHFDEIWRGDLHMDLRPNKTSWDPQIVPLDGDGLTATLECRYNGTPTWQVLDARSGELTALGNANPLVHTVEGHGLYDYFCTIDGKTTGYPVEFFDDHDPYYADEQGVPLGVTNVWNRSSELPEEPILNSPTNETLLNNTPTNNTTEVSLSVEENQILPYEHNYLFRCVAEGFTPDRFVFTFGDDNSQIKNNSPNYPYKDDEEGPENYAKALYSYQQDDNYNISCTAESEEHNQTSSMQVNVEGIEEMQFHTALLNNTHHLLTCTPSEFKNPQHYGTLVHITNPDGDMENSNAGTDSTVSIGSPNISVPFDSSIPGEYEITCQIGGGDNINFPGYYQEDPNNSYTDCYFPGNSACLTEISSTNVTLREPICGNSIIEEGEACDDGNTANGDGCSATCTIEDEAACFNSLNELPVNCTGTITSDVKGSPRTIVCSADDGSIEVRAWERDDSTGNHFEMWRINSNGTAPVVCLGEDCLESGWGYERGSNYPICLENTTQPEPPGTPTNETMCFTSLQELPATCNGGTITNDTYDGCRQIICATNESSLQVLACPKPDVGDKEYFEMYKQSDNPAALEICLGETCIQENGFAKSNEFPICTGNITQPPTNETMCFDTLEHIPATCDGELTKDTFNGCRELTCENADGTVNVLACPKPDVGDKEYFEMYKQFSLGTTPQVCLGETCIQENGFAQSNEFPICTGNEPPPNDTKQTVFAQPVWIEPTEGLTGVTLNQFHLATNPPNEEVIASDWEIWNETQRIWHATNNTGTITFHTHTPDGVFETNNSQLEPLTTYKARVRYQYANATGPWSEWRSFTTRDSTTLNPSTPDWTAAEGYHVEKFASGFDVPVHLAFAPNIYEHLNENQQPYLYVTELYGTVKVVYADGSSAVYADDLLNFNPFGSITGGGQMGTISLYVEPETGDLYVGTVYLDGDDVYNKIIKFTTHNDGHNFTSQETLIDGLPSGPSHQIQQITRGPDGKIYVNLGEGLNPADAQNDSILAGKIIRMNPNGTNVETYAKGFRNPFGADWRPGTNQLIVTDNAPDQDDRLVAVEEGVNYGWGMQDSLATFLAERIDTLNVSPVDVEFNPGLANFSELYVAVAGPIYQLGPTDGKQILEYTLNPDASVSSRNIFVEYTGDGYGTPIGLDFGPDGLYFTDIYGEPGFVGLGETESNIYRVVPGEPSNETQEQLVFRAGISVIPWYPKDTGEGIEYIFECQGIEGSGNYSYEFDFGTGSFDIGGNRQYMSYPYGDVNYTVSCTANDLETQESVGASLVVNPSNFIAE